MRNTSKGLLLALCTTGLLACGQESATTENGQADEALKLNRLSSGDMEYCDQSGECQTLPYSGECQIIEISIDTATGLTCQSCTLADGTTVDQGCSGTAVACVLVTLPEPDCVVCAYVNGAILFSNCTPEEAGCQTDADCVSSVGSARCVNGQCETVSGCSVDSECPEGFYCQAEICPAMCRDDGVCPPCTGTCQPAATDCTMNNECPAGMECRRYCMGACDSAGNCYEDDCKGVCEPVQAGCYSNDECPAGYVCEFYYDGAPASSDASGEMAPPYGVCVPQDYGCQSNWDCPSGTVCEYSCTPSCDPNMQGCDDASNCQGVCVQRDPICYSDAECPAGYVCSLSTATDPNSDPSAGVPYVEVGYCVPVQFECMADEECPAGYSCQYSNCGSTPEGDASNCFVAAGICVPNSIQCMSDAECMVDCDPTGATDCIGSSGVCIGGVCTYQVDCNPANALCDMIPPTCPEGQAPSVVNGCFGECVDASLCIVVSDCVISGCSGELCGDVPMYSTCVWRDQYACFSGASCERQADGVCGWTVTEELQVCLNNPTPIP